jgi:hypothetical protein
MEVAVNSMRVNAKRLGNGHGTDTSGVKTNGFSTPPLPPRGFTFKDFLESAQLPRAGLSKR